MTILNYRIIDNYKSTISIKQGEFILNGNAINTMDI